jgi:D-alanyl-D-alanine carboxypeptidase
MNSVQAERHFDKQKMDNYLALLSENNKAILSVEIVEKGKQVYQNQTGVAYFDSKGIEVKADAQTQYRVGSITKMFTATLVMQLIEQNKLSLSTPLSTFFPEIKNADTITIDHMLMHSSGLLNYTDTTEFWQYFTEPQSQQKMVKRFAEFEPVFKPGSTSRYSNTNYMLLGYIIEKITGQSYQDVLQKNIIDKLSLKHTHLGGVIDTSQNQAQSFYFSQNNWQAKTQWHMSNAMAAGAITSNPHDLNIFINALMSYELLSKASTQNMLSSKYYGKGILRLPFEERYSYGHYGSIESFYSALMYFPEEDMSLAVNVNGLSLNFHNDIVYAILSIYYNKPYAIPDFSHPVVQINTEVLSKLEGHYSYQQSNNFTQKIDNPTQKIDVYFFNKDGQLWGKIPDINNPEADDLQVSFVPSSENTFWNKSDGIEITFSKDSFGGLKNKAFRLKYNDGRYLFIKQK